MTDRKTPRSPRGAARAVLTATTLTGLCLGLAFGGVATANAEAIIFNATAAQLEAACTKVGGTFVKHRTGGGSTCFTKSGAGVCDPSGSCAFIPNRPIRQTEPIPLIVGTADNAGVA